MINNQINHNALSLDYMSGTLPTNLLLASLGYPFYDPIVITSLSKSSFLCLTHVYTANVRLFSLSFVFRRGTIHSL